MMSLHFTCMRKKLAAFFSLHFPSTDHSHYLFLQISALLRAMRHDQDTKNNDAFILSRCKMIAQIDKNIKPQRHEIHMTYNRVYCSLQYDKILCTFVRSFFFFFWLRLEKALIMSHCLSCSYKVQGTF